MSSVFVLCLLEQMCSWETPQTKAHASILLINILSLDNISVVEGPFLRRNSGHRLAPFVTPLAGLPVTKGRPNDMVPAATFKFENFIPVHVYLCFILAYPAPQTFPHSFSLSLFLPGRQSRQTALINDGVKAHADGVRRGNWCDQLSSGRFSLIRGLKYWVSLGGKLRSSM